MKPFEYNRKLLVAVISILLGIALLNVFVDPYNIFNFPPINHINYYRPEIKRQERLTKFMSLKTIGKADTLFVGTSRPDWSLKPDYYNLITNKKAANMALAHVEFCELKDIINSSLKIHPEIKTVLIGIDFVLEDLPLKDKESSLGLDTNKYLTFKEITSVINSIDTTFSSFATIAKNVSSVKKKRYFYDGTKQPFHNDNIKGSFYESLEAYKAMGTDFSENDIDLSLMKDFVNELNAKGIEVILYMPPLHATFIQIFDSNNSMDKIDLIKEKFSEIAPLYDFMYIHPLNTEVIDPDMKYYFEASHATYLVGEKIQDKIFTGKGNFGVLLTPENVKAHNLNNRKLLYEWQKQNPELKSWVDSIVNAKSEEK